MKQVFLIILTLFIYTSLSADTIREQSYKILLTSKDFYEMDFNKQKCTKMEKYVQKSLLEGYKTGKFSYALSKYNMPNQLIALNDKLPDNNGRYIFVWVVGKNIHVVMPNNKSFCSKLVVSNGEKIKNYILSYFTRGKPVFSTYEDTFIIPAQKIYKEEMKKQGY